MILNGLLSKTEQGDGRSRHARAFVAVSGVNLATQVTVMSFAGDQPELAPVERSLTRARK